MTTRPVLAATILAAGLGTRLGGQPKVALAWQGLSLMERLCLALRGAGIEDLSIVIGPYADTLQPLAAHCGLRVLAQEGATQTLVGSQRLAVRQHVARLPDSDLLLLVGDLPLLDAGAVTALCGAWQARAQGVDLLQPVVAGTRGHPVALGARALAEIDGLPADQGVRAWMQAHTTRCTAWASNEAAYVTDLDTPEDLERISQALALCDPHRPLR